MKTICGSGASSHLETRAAVDEAMAQAVSRLQGRAPSLGILFVSSRHGVEAAQARAKEVRPACDFVLATTAGEITDHGLTEGGIAVMLIAWGDAKHAIHSAASLDTDIPQLVGEICGGFQLASDPPRHGLYLLLGDGLSGNFEKLVVEILKQAAPDHQIVGGGAGDDGKLVRTFVGANGSDLNGGVVAVLIESRARWGTGVGHGVSPITPRMTVTRARGNVVHELDGEGALDFYRRLAASRGVALNEENTPGFLVSHELGVMLFEQPVRVRAPIRVEPDGGLFFAGEVPEGSTVCVVHGTPEAMIDAAREAAETARQALDGVPAAGVLVFSCICRRLTLGSRYGEELDALRAVFPNVPIVGSSSYGEIARSAGKLDGYHNNTIVVAAIPAG